MKTLKAVCVILVLASAYNALAADFDFGLSAGWSRSDNVGRTSVNEQTEDIGLLDLRLNGSHVTRKVDFAVDADIGYRYYFDDTYDGEVVGGFTANLDLGLVPEVLNWNFSNSYGTIQSDPFRPSSPENRENINNFSTGPDLQIRLGAVTAMEFAARYRKNTFEFGDIDNQVIGGSAALVRALSPNRSVSLNVSTDSVEYDDETLDSDYDRHSAYVRLLSQMSKGSLDVALGGNQLDNGIDTLDGFLADISFTRALSSRSNFTASYNQQFSDSSDIFRRYQNPGQRSGEDIDVAASSSPFESRRFQIGVNHDRGTSNWYAFAYAFDEDYVRETSLDRRRYGVRVGTSMESGSGWGVRLEGRLETGTLQAADRDDDDTFVRVALSRRLGRQLNLQLAYDLADRSSTDPDAEYRENRISLTLGYSRD